MPTQFGSPRDAMVGTLLELDVSRAIDQLHDDRMWSRGQNAKTLVKYDDFRIVLTALKAGQRLPGHTTRARISIHAMRGHLLVHVDGRPVDLPAGRLLALDRDVPHDVEALEDSAFLLTMAWPQRQS